MTDKRAIDLGPEQLAPLEEKPRQITAWLHALQKRMEQRRFPREDELFKLTREAFDNVRWLRMAIHYLESDRTPAAVTTSAPKFPRGYCLDVT
jgi:hypothetical protein